MFDDLNFRFEHDGRTVLPGQVMHVAPAYHRQAGAMAVVERHYGDGVMLRTDNGAIPTVPLHALSWEPHPETTALEELRQAGFSRPTNRDVAVWLAARKPPNAEVSGCLRAPMPEDAPRTAAGSPLDRPVGPVAGA